MKLLKYGKNQFMFVLTKYVYANHNLVNRLFFVSVSSVFISNIVFIIELFIGNSRYAFKIWLLIIIIFEFLMCFISTICLIYFCEKPYKFSRIYYRNFVIVTKNYYINIGNYIKSALFIELIITKKKFSFSLGCFGRMTRKNLLNFLPIHSSLIMFVLPLIYKKQN